MRYYRLKVDRVIWSQCDDGPNFLSPAWLVMTLAGTLSACLFVRSAWKYPAPPTQTASAHSPDGTPSPVAVEPKPGDGGS